MFKNLPKQMFGAVQSKTFPWYFRILAVGNVILLFTLRQVFGDHVKIIANAEGFLSFDFRNPYLVQVYLLLTSLLVVIVNMVFVGPWVTQVMFLMYKIEKDNDEAKLKKQKSLFGALHGISSLLNLTALLCWVGHVWFLSSRLAVVHE